MPNKPKLRCSPYHKHSIPLYVYIADAQADAQRANLIRSSDWSGEKSCPEVSWALEWDISVDKGTPTWGVRHMGEILYAICWNHRNHQEITAEIKKSCLDNLRNHKQNHVILKSCSLQTFMLGPSHRLTNIQALLNSDKKFFLWPYHSFNWFVTVW